MRRTPSSCPSRRSFPQGDQQFLYRIVDGKAIRTKVDVGQRRDARVEVLTGVSADDTIVTAGHLKLRDGATVKIAGGDAPKGPATAAAPPASGAAARLSGNGPGGAPADASARDIPASPPAAPRKS